MFIIRILIAIIGPVDDCTTFCNGADHRIIIKNILAHFVIRFSFAHENVLFEIYAAIVHLVVDCIV